MTRYVDKSFWNCLLHALEQRRKLLYDIERRHRSRTPALNRLRHDPNRPPRQ